MKVEFDNRSVTKLWQPSPEKFEAIELSKGLGSALATSVVVVLRDVVVEVVFPVLVVIPIEIVVVLTLSLVAESEPDSASALLRMYRWCSSRDIMIQSSSMRTGTRVSTISVSCGCGGAMAEKAAAVETQQSIKAKIIALLYLGPARNLKRQGGTVQPEGTAPKRVAWLRKPRS